MSTSGFSGLPAIIGGTGLDWSEGSALRDARPETVETRWGSASVTHAEFEGRPLVFLHRHAAPDSKPGHPKKVPPHAVNYRANIAALKQLGVTAIFASTAVGSLRRDWGPGTLVLLDDLIDFTSGRARTFFERDVVHVDATRIYCPHARSFVLSAARESDIALQDGGVYLCAEGPRFETPAEIRLFAGWGADVVGMTGAPEAALAREAQISYAGLSIVTNLAAGISPEPLSQGEVLEAMGHAMPQVSQMLLRAALSYRDDPQVLARRSTREFVTPGFEPDDAIA